MVVLSLYKKTNIGYTQHVHDHVHVDAVVYGAVYAGAYFLLKPSDAHLNFELHGVPKTQISVSRTSLSTA